MPSTAIAKETTSAGGPEPADRAHHKIRSLAVSAGFLESAELDFADGLNCIIGGRGTGKTTVLEFMRYVLGPMPDGTEGKVRARAIEALVRGNLGPGTIGLAVETKHGTRYRAERPWDDAVQVLDGDGEPVAVSLDRDLVFKADFYSQNEIEEIATTPSFQLALIDKFEEEAIREADAELAKLARAIEQSAMDLCALERDIGEIEDVIPEVDIVAKRLGELQAADGPEAEAINAAQCIGAAAAPALQEPGKEGAGPMGVIEPIGLRGADGLDSAGVLDGELVLPILRGLPQRVIDDAELGHVCRDPVLGRVDARDSLARSRVFDAA